MRVLSVVGARPQFMKLAPLHRELVRRGHEHIILHTGQHYSPTMSGRFFGELGIPEPAINLGLESSRPDAMLPGLEEAVARLSPDWVLVYGDTNTTLAGALAAAKLPTRLAHVEAGLRSGRWDMPEEVARVVSDRISDLLLAPTPTACQNLEREGLGHRAHWVGDLLLDLFVRRFPGARRARVWERWGLREGEYAYMTLHRNFNVDSPKALSRILDRVEALGGRVLWPIHPRTEARLQEFGLSPPKNALVIPPVSHTASLSLLAGARFVITDSGGLVREAHWAGTPCVLLRGETEWPEAGALLCPGGEGLDRDRVEALIIEAKGRKRGTGPFGVGEAAKRVVEVLGQWFLA